MPRKQKVIVAKIEILGIIAPHDLERHEAMTPERLTIETAKGLANYFGPKTLWQLEGCTLEERYLPTEGELTDMLGRPKLVL